MNAPSSGQMQMADGLTQTTLGDLLGVAHTEVDRYSLAIRLKGYLHAHGDALALAHEAVERHPGNVHLLELRGEKHLVVRDVVSARADFERAVELLANHGDELQFYRPDVESDIVDLVLGRRQRHVRVNERAKGTVHAATWYFAGFVRFLDGAYASAVDAFDAAIAIATDGHLGLAARDWRYLALVRLGRLDAAMRSLAVGSVLESATDSDAGSVSRKLTDAFTMRLRLYRGELQPEDLLRVDTTSPLALATLGYGVGAWYHATGLTVPAHRSWQHVVDHGEWASSSTLAAEIDLARQH